MSLRIACRNGFSVEHVPGFAYAGNSQNQKAMKAGRVLFNSQCKYNYSQRLRIGLVFKAHKLLYLSTLGLRVKTEKNGPIHEPAGCTLRAIPKKR